MNRRVIIAVATIAAVIILGFGALVVLVVLVATPRVSSQAARRVSAALGRAVHLSSVSPVVFPFLGVRLKELQVAEDPSFGITPFLTLNQVDVRLRLWPLLHRQVEIDSIVLDRPNVRIIQGPDGRVNAASLGSAQPSTPRTPATEGVKTAAALLGTRVQLDGGIVTYISRGSDGAESQYDLDEVALTLTADSTLAFQGSGRLQPGDIAVTIADGTVAPEGVAQMSDAPLRARVTLNARDITDLAAAVFGPAPAVNGGAQGVLSVAGTLAKPTASGDIELPWVALTRTSPQCPEPRRRTLTFQTLKVGTTWEDGRLIGRPAAVELRKGTITSTLVVTFDPSVRVEFGDLTITDLPLDAVLAEFFCEGYAVTGPLELTGRLSLGASTTSLGQLRIGPGQIVGPQALAFHARMLRVGGAVSALLSADLPRSLFSSPLDFDSITATYQITNGVLNIRDLRYVSDAMTISAAGVYELATAQMNLDLVVNHGRGEAYAKVTGSADAPLIHVRPSTILRDVDPGKIGQGIQNWFKGLF